ncbi:MAG: DUF1161 domain-containing protein [Terriglobales bacterium]
MKPLTTIAVLLLAAASAGAQAPQAAQTPQAPLGPKSCEELKTEIAAKLDAKGVKPYTLEIVDKDKEAEGKVVGTCGGGTKKIMYLRTSTPPQTPAPEASKP